MNRLIEVSLAQHASKYLVTPLQPVEETMKDDEVQVGDIAILAGQYLIIAVPGEGLQDWGYVMTNYLKIQSVEEMGQEMGRTRRGRNRNQRVEALVPSMFC